MDAIRSRCRNESCTDGEIRPCLSRRNFRICRGGARPPGSSSPDWSRGVTRRHSAIGSQMSSATSITSSVLSWFGSSGARTSPYTHAYNVVEPAVAFAVAEVKDAANDLPSARWVGTAISLPLDQDCRAVVGIDGGAKVRTERPGCGSALREVRAPEATTDRTLAAALSEKQVLLPPAVELDHPTLRIGEANPIQRLESQSCTPAASRPDVSGEHYRTDLAAPPGRCAAVLTHPEPLFRGGARPHVG